MRRFDRPGPAASPLGLGLIGCGGFGRFLLASTAELPTVRLAAVTDPDAAAATAAGREWGARTHGSVAELLADPAVALVAVASPPASHAALTVAALESGHDVLCEKPMALGVAAAGRVLDAVARTGRVVAVDHVLRFNPLLACLQRLAAATADGAPLLGSLRRFAVENDASDEHLPPGHWFWDEAVSGGILVEHGVHFFDAGSWLLGSDPVSVQALATGWVRPEVIDTVVATAVHPGGATASYLHAFTHADRAEHQTLRCDWGYAEARLRGWIPVELELDAWVGPEGRALLTSLPGRTAEMLAVPDHRLTGSERIDVTVLTADAPPVGHARGGDRPASHRLRVTASLGGEPAKGRVYAESVRAALADLVDAVRSGRAPTVDAAAGWRAVATAAAARTAARTGMVVRPARLGEPAVPVTRPLSG